MMLGQIILSFAIAQYGLVPLIADLNSSHALNPAWPAHARFHVVTQALTSSLTALAAVIVLWLPVSDAAFRASIAAAMSACVLGGFFLSAILARLLGGEISAPHALRIAKLDGNVVNFGIASLLLVSGWVITQVGAC